MARSFSELSIRKPKIQIVDSNRLQGELLAHALTLAGWSAIFSDDNDVKLESTTDILIVSFGSLHILHQEDIAPLVRIKKDLKLIAMTDHHSPIVPKLPIELRAVIYMQGSFADCVAVINEVCGEILRLSTEIRDPTLDDSRRRSANNSRASHD